MPGASRTGKGLIRTGKGAGVLTAGFGKSLDKGPCAA